MVASIYRAYSPYMFYKAVKVLGNPDDAEDAVHNAMLKIIKHIDVIDTSDIKRLKPLCGVMAKNAAIDIARIKDNRHEELDDEVGNKDGDGRPEEVLIKDETYNIIVESLRMLDEKYRDVLILKFSEDLKEREIALLLGVPEKTVDTRIRRGKEMLKKILETEGIHG